MNQTPVPGHVEWATISVDSVAASVREVLSRQLADAGVPVHLIDSQHYPATPFTVRVGHPRDASHQILVLPVGPHLVKQACVSAPGHCGCGESVTPVNDLGRCLSGMCEEHPA